MELIIQEIGKKISKNIGENIKTLLDGENNISDYILDTKYMLDEIGSKIVAETLELVDKLVKENKTRKRDYRVKSKGIKKSLSTIFGEIKYIRTYYENKNTGEYRYLSDELVGIEAGDKIDSLLKAKLIEEAIYTPYRRSGEKAVESIEISPQTVMNSIRELEKTKIKMNKMPNKSKIKRIYIEADEDHVSLQNGRNIEPKLVYVHEGKKEITKNRYKLINPRYFGGVYKKSEELWLEVADYIDEVYPEAENIYLSGDGAKWIKQGLEWINKSIYVLDKFHLNKYIKKATAHVPKSINYMYKYIKKQSKTEVKKLLEALIEATESETKKESIKYSKRYILNNWEGILNGYNKDYIGCSAEGHISHILSSRLSSRPLSWSVEGVELMSKLRIYKANKGDIYNLVKENKKAKRKETKILKLDKRIVKKAASKISRENLDNIPAINEGKRTWAREYFKALRGA